jgi:hypothetical protein
VRHADELDPNRLGKVATPKNISICRKAKMTIALHLQEAATMKACKQIETQSPPAKLTKLYLLQFQQPCRLGSFASQRFDYAATRHPSAPTRLAAAAQQMCGRWQMADGKYRREE